MSDQASDVGSMPATITDHEYAVVSTSTDDIRAILQENTGGSITPQDLDQIKVPTGGGLHFRVPTLEGEQPAETIEGVIVYFTKPRVFWKEAFGAGGGGTPPDCSSLDAVTGQGDPGGDCAECPMAKFGTAVDAQGNAARGQACSQKNLLFMLRKDDILPIVIVGPPTSLRNIRQYLLRLANNRSRYYSVVTKLKLTKASNKDGIAYAQIEPSFASRLDDEAVAAMNAYHKFIAPVLEAVAMSLDDE